ncbi:SdrD B-like domain-containing protein [Acinetobacter junii]|uniref:prealbumin-like fold domain-containing protein n=1 Tax=Acinetobacter junii TaxID=40215 RepID=UPI0024B736B8|nr:SdrD B-like domain-containing protein [Acinetobacter junii]MDI9720794.1 SdrD B-like domain-containing protein [Acinetobacter junii]
MWVSKQIMKKNTSNYSMMNHKVSYIYTLVLFILTCLMCSQAVLAAPPTIEIFSGSGSGQGPTAGPVTTTFRLNANNPSDNANSAYLPLTTATYTVTESVYNRATYPSSAGGGTTRPNLTIGGSGTAATVAATNVILPLTSYGASADDMFAASIQNAPTGCVNGSNCPSTNGGIKAGSSSSDTTANYGVTVHIKTAGFSSSRGSLNLSTTARIRVGQIKIEFNRPVNNPILQAAGMGGANGNFGASAEFTLVGGNTPVILSRLAGSKELSVIGNDITNNASKKGANSNAGGASGSIYIKGKGIQTLVFDVYIKGDGGSDGWSDTGADTFFFGMSSMDADSDIALVKAQRVGNTGTFVGTQLDNLPVNSLMQYQLTITNNTPAGASLGGTVANLPFNDTLPVSLKNVSIVGTPTTTQGTGGTSPSATSCTPSLTGNDNTGWTVSGLFTGATTATCIITIQGTATAVGTLTNTATIESTSSDTPVSSSVNAVIVNPTAITADPTIKEARFTITPDLPTIVRGRVGTQTINIKNEGPDSATNAKAVYVAAPQTGVTVSSVSVVGSSSSTCVQSGNNWNCDLGDMTNGATKQLSVSYSTTAASSLGTAQQATVKVSSDEFNPGSGVGETLYKVWGSNQQNEYRPNGAFWVGYTGASGTSTTSTYANDTTSLLSAWPATQSSPTGAYFLSGGPTVRDSIYAASSSTASAMIQQVINGMTSNSTVATVKLNEINNPDNGDIGDNRRAWEFTTGIYADSNSTLNLCLGNVDDGAYVMVDGVQVATIANTSGSFVTSTPVTAGYHRVTYRIVNRNTYSGMSELGAGGYGPIGMSLSGACTTSGYDAVTGVGVPASINIIDGAKIKIAKNSVNGTGTFNYINLSNLVDSTTAVTTDSVTTVTAGTTATSAQQLWAQTLNTDVSFTESALAGYVLSGVSCVDANSGVTGNTGTFWTLVNNIVTIPAVRIKEGANITCTFTNTKLVYVDITGRVFFDNSGTTLDVSKAYNGIQDAGEVGIANSTIRLNNCSTTQLASTVTSANGDYAFSIEQSLLPSSFCIVQQNLPEYISVSGTTGYTRSTDTIALTKTSATSYTANNFGDVIVNVVLNEDGQHTAIAGDVTDYPHRLSTQIPVQLTQLLQTQTQQPNSSADQPWQALVYRDTNCNGQVDMGEVVFNPTAASTVLLQPSVDICLVQRVHVPTNVAAGAQHIGTLQASYQFALTSPSQTILGQTLKRQDVTLIGSAGLTLTKKVRAVASCPSTSSDTNAFVTTNQAAKQDNLEYEITYKNNSTKKLQNVKVKDSLPIGTNFGSVSCSLTPSGNTCNTNRSGDYLEWSLTGLLNPSASGTLRFCVSQ